MFNSFQSKTLSLSMEQAKTNLAKDTSIKLIDVRAPKEYSQGHIPGGINIPLDKASDIETILPDKNEKLYVYCQSGMRSKSASELFKKIGYTDITDIGGISSWKGDIVKKQVGKRS